MMFPGMRCMPTGDNGSKGRELPAQPGNLSNRRHTLAGVMSIPMTSIGQQCPSPGFLSVQHRHRVIRENIMNAQLRRFFREEDGVTALEYGLLAAVVAGLIIFFARDGLMEVFTTVLAKLTALVNGADSGGGSGSGGMI